MYVCMYVCMYVWLEWVQVDNKGRQRKSWSVGEREAAQQAAELEERDRERRKREQMMQEAANADGIEFVGEDVSDVDLIDQGISMPHLLSNSLSLSLAPDLSLFLSLSPSHTHTPSALLSVCLIMLCARRRRWGQERLEGSWREKQALEREARLLSLLAGTQRGPARESGGGSGGSETDGARGTESHMR